MQKAIKDALLLKSMRGKYSEEKRKNISKLNLLFLINLLLIKKIVTYIINKSDPLCGSNLSEIVRIKPTTDSGSPYIEKKYR